MSEANAEENPQEGVPTGTVSRRLTAAQVVAGAQLELLRALANSPNAEAMHSVLVELENDWKPMLERVMRNGR